MPSEKWTWETESVWWESKGDWTWKLLPSCFFDLWHHGAYCDSCIQENSFNDRRQVQQALQQDYALDEVSSQLFPSSICRYVSSRQQILSPSPSALTSGLSGPRLLRRPGPIILLISLSSACTDISLFLHIFLLSLLYWVSLFIYVIYKTRVTLGFSHVKLSHELL